MVVAEGTRAPMESLLFTDQCVYLRRKHLLWGSRALSLLVRLCFQTRALQRKKHQVQDCQDFGWTQVSVGLGPFELTQEAYC